MKVSFNNRKELIILEDETSLNVNDFMRHRLLVYTTPALLPNESLWVLFENENGDISKTAILVKEYKNMEEYYTLTIPYSVTSVSGKWKFQLLVKRLKTTSTVSMTGTDETGDKASQYQTVYSSEEGFFTISEALKTPEGEVVTDVTIAQMYEIVQGVKEDVAHIPEITSADEGKFLRVVDGVWKAEIVPSAEDNSF